MYLLIAVVALAIALLIRFVIVPALRRSSAASDLSLYRHHLAGLQPPFVLTDGERVVLSLVARDLGAVRNLASDSTTQDAFPASFPLVFCTSQRLVVLMSTTDRPTAITGTYPARQPNLRERIGEQFDESNGRFVSSASWRWETIGMMVAEGREVGLSWTDREGVGIALLGFVDATDLGHFVTESIGLIGACRGRAGISPSAPASSTEGAQTTYTFEHPLVTCATCSTPIADSDRFCTGCGAVVARMEHA